MIAHKIGNFYFVAKLRENSIKSPRGVDHIIMIENIWPFSQFSIFMASSNFMNVPNFRSSKERQYYGYFYTDLSHSSDGRLLIPSYPIWELFDQLISFVLADTSPVPVTRTPPP